MSEQTSPHHSHTQYLWFLTISYTMCLIMANWYVARLIYGFGLTFDAGILIFPFTFLISDLITEVYGYQYARQAIWCGFFFNLFFILYGQLVTHLPSPPYPTRNHLFDEVLNIDFRILMASGISYFCSEPLNAFILAKMKIYTAGKKMASRFVLSTVFASGLDSLIFSLLAFYGVIDTKNLGILILTNWGMKVGIEILALPLSLYLARTLKKIETIDIYDKNTNFSLFKLKVHYTKSDNEFGKQRNLK